MLYVVAGDALPGRQDALSVTSGWFGIVPRGVEYSLTRKGRNPVVLLSIVAGRPCSDPSVSRR
jgi:hypothetical protein